ncbi:hypothetical protein AB2L57_09615 [Microbacterium sp. HA-8]|uniref:hypothetical protein n=1 Tax=Microbacterium sp. HA-8 TaxID=3234200 RepID=UPI0038F75285
MLDVMRERAILRSLVLMAEWLHGRTRSPVGSVRSYGKTVDPAVRALLTLLQTRGRNAISTPRSATFSMTDRGKRWQLLDFSGTLVLHPDVETDVVHTDVTWGKDRGERRLIRDDENRRNTESDFALKLIGGGDKLLVGYVDQIEDDDERCRYYLVIPPSSSGTRAAIGSPGGFSRLSPAQVTGLEDLVNRAARQAQDAMAPPVSRPRPESTRVVKPVESPVAELGRVAWDSLVGVLPAQAEWTERLGVQIASAARRGLAEPSLRERLSRTQSTTGGATVSRLENGSASRSELQAVISAAVLFDVAREADDRVAIRREIFSYRSLGFLRPAWERIQPLLGEA